jgi:hypothetical protein
MGLLSVVGSIAGSLIGANKAKKAQKKYNKRRASEIANLTKLIDSWTTSGNQLLAQKGGLLQQMLQQSEAGGRRSEAAVGSLGQSAYRRINEREQQSLGAMNSGLAQRGLYNTTVGANLQRGIQADSNRAFGEVDEGLAGLRSSLINQNTSRNMGALGMLGNLHSEQLAFGSSQLDRKAALSGESLKGSISQSPGYGQMGSQLGSLLGGLFPGNPLNQQQQQQVAGIGAGAAKKMGLGLAGMLTGGWN